MSIDGGRFYWERNSDEKVKGIVIIFAWISIDESELKNYVHLYASLGWNSLVCLADFATLYIPEKATSLAYSLLRQLVEELRCRPCPVVVAAFSGGSKACMYKFFQIVKGRSEAQVNLEDSQLVINCISGQIYDSCPVDFTADFGTQFAVPPTILKLPGSTKLLSLVAKGFTSGLDALFITRFGSQRSEYWRTLYSSVSFGAPFLILCSENDDIAPYQSVCKFAHSLQDMGADIKMIMWKGSCHAALNVLFGFLPQLCGYTVGSNFLLVPCFERVHQTFYRHLAGLYKSDPIQYGIAIDQLLAHAASVFTSRIKKLVERNGLDDMHDEISHLICDLQNAAADSNGSFRRVAGGPNDHFFLPSSSDRQNVSDSGSSSEERKDLPIWPNPSLSAHTVLGQILFDACVPKNVEGWDVKYTSSLKCQPFSSARKHSPLNAIKYFRRSRL
ncbi:putative presequence protease 2, chloroplastic/mitochondrial-like [Capsicum annuum]|nr:putative presequence protease 2, chloroplastic/mitochondrial-like [Capsicum annuum]